MFLSCFLFSFLDFFSFTEVFGCHKTDKLNENSLFEVTNKKKKKTTVSDSLCVLKIVFCFQNKIRTCRR